MPRAARTIRCLFILAKSRWQSSMIPDVASTSNPDACTHEHNRTVVVLLPRVSSYFCRNVLRRHRSRVMLLPVLPLQTGTRSTEAI